MKKSRHILLGVYIINFLILLTIFIKNGIDKKFNTKIYLGVYFWIINLIEIVIFSANLKKINKKIILIAITVLFCIQTVILFFVPAYSQYEPSFTRDKDGYIIPTATVMPNYYNAYGIHIK